MTTVRDVMISEPVTMDASETLTAAARQMRDASVGDVIVTEAGELRGLVTDRDITIRGVAEELDPDRTSLGEILTRDLVTVAADADVETAVELVRTHAVRRLPVLDGGRLVGVVSLGDLAAPRS
jgi:CBS domain-containing protein